ncbi:ARM repeat-containing protein [Pleomassaria siparia CBS 279.74]|uniref:ARM repeat-containing protein n=1 Tax=Pleomassaria siparia CBS 279.74 TaxID=1314801 RepID=A0A6G1KEH5_9PLEO|nr:ARM repeat-containing protein [Pleomassaria siparia CBS 279.74]
MSLNITSDGSPTPRKGAARFSVAEDLRVDTSPEGLGMAAVGSRHPLAPYRFGGPFLTSKSQQGLKRLNGKVSDAYKIKIETDAQNEQPSVVDSLLQRLSERSSPHDQPFSSSTGSSVPITPATEQFMLTPSTNPDSSVVVGASELQKLKNDLEVARNEVARMNQELHTTHLTKSTLDHIGQSSEADYNHYKGDVTEQTISQLQNKFNASTRPTYGRQESWQEDTLSDKSDTKPFVNGQAIWGNGARQPTAAMNNAAPAMGQQYPATMNNTWGNESSRSFYGGNMNMNSQAFGPIQPRPSTGQSAYRGRNGYLNEPTHFPLDQGYRGSLASNPPSRPNSAFDGPRYNQYSNYANSSVDTTVRGMSPILAPMPPIGMYAPSVNMTPYQPRPIGSMKTRLSPEAAEFSVDALAPTPWNTLPASESGAQYIAPMEPLNYRRLLDRNMSCNWKYIVDKIICNNDQQASIFLQQKLKVGTAEQKFEIVEAIIAQAYPLMVNRFGNFLVQRCFEHGTLEQVISIAGAIRGNTLTLSMDAFGCHVIQKAFDAVPEEYKATMVHELLRRIPETVIHRYACHVWQKLFELRWSDSPPQIMRYVNEALRGMWHEVALGETGSLVVQNIFENCLEEDKRPCINEVLASIDVISHGQFGNWCIQHICEHGAPADRGRAIDHILRFATEYSMDQYASKVIEKCLKIGGNEFLDRYLERVCEAREARPRMPLIDIAGDQFGNYLVQYILTNSSTHHRDMVASHVRKHMVSLRGSKYGSRVAMLCCNPAVATRPGPPAGLQMNRYTTHSIHRGGGGSGAYGGFR